MERMVSETPIAVHVGRALLTSDGLFINDEEVQIIDAQEYRSFIFSTQAIIVDALASVFPDDTGELFQASASRLGFREGIAPWDQYARESIRHHLHSVNIILGWCYLLDLVARLKPEAAISPEALLVARYAIGGASKAAMADPEVVKKWLHQMANRDLISNVIARLSGEVEAVEDPYSAKIIRTVPWPSILGEFLPMKVIVRSMQDMMITKGMAHVSVSPWYQVYGPSPYDELLAVGDQGDEKRIHLEYEGVSVMFRTYHGGTYLSMRPLPTDPFQVGDQ
jgi:hypothetical protein